MKRSIALGALLLLLTGCAMTPEQQAAFIRAMGQTAQQNSQRMMQRPQIQAPVTTQTQCHDNGFGGVTCTSQTY